ncbi:MAG TPA: protein-L-isoaspartate(D-aspartate) O-methyltransferase [Polyangiaceae bacterium]|jgi:protein-L-isoaspartate(D-aspartate) O-methyltransferase|nr:protein-L-isoaspartate(D-aspartate) O-methyltransferase [Polyangiaceae bacterium]
MANELSSLKERLAERIRASTGLDDARILQAFIAVPRHEFLPETQFPFAYEDRALPLDEGQTISQPSMIAIMLKELECEPRQRALEVGAGSGYAAAVLGQLVAEVYTIEVRPALAERARNSLERSRANNVHVVLGDGSLGLPAHAPYDRILVSAAPDRVPQALVEQLAVGGKIAIPVGDEHAQTLLVGRKTGPSTVDWQKTVPCIFVPLVTH